jgi:hypothetical protein
MLLYNETYQYINNNMYKRMCSEHYHTMAGVLNEPYSQQTPLSELP